MYSRRKPTPDLQTLSLYCHLWLYFFLMCCFPYWISFVLSNKGCFLFGTETAHGDVLKFLFSISGRCPTTEAWNTKVRAILHFSKEVRGHWRSYQSLLHFCVKERLWCIIHWNKARVTLRVSDINRKELVLRSRRSLHLFMLDKRLVSVQKKYTAVNKDEWEQALLPTNCLC